jgi:hypothetical protein
MLDALVQGGAADIAKAAAEVPTLNQIGNWSLATGCVVALVFAVKAWRDSVKEAAALAAQAAKEAADRMEKQNLECHARNEKTVAVVDGICERFTETTTLNTKMLSDTVTQLRTDQVRQQEQFMALAREQREAHERREERLEQTLRSVHQQNKAG